MQSKSFIAFAGFVLLIAGTWCPLIRAFGLMNMDVYDASKPYGIVILLIGIVGIIGVILRQAGLARTAAWVSIFLVVLLFIATEFKISHFFSFIPFNGLARAFTRGLKLKWGWIIFFGGALLATAGSLGMKKVPDASR